MNSFHPCHVTLTNLDFPTIVSLVPCVILRMEGRTLPIAVVTAVFLPSVRRDVVLAEVGRVAKPLALLHSDNSSSMVIIVVVAEALPVKMFPMKLGRTLTNLPSTSPLPT